MKKLHLDSEYRDRWVEFHLADGTVEDSRLKNWRQVAWGQVICLSVHMLNHVHTVDCTGVGFKTFMNFRWGGMDKGRQIKIWTIGWTNGETCFLKDVCFYTGQLIKEYTSTLLQFKVHLHPDVEARVLRL